VLVIPIKEGRFAFCRILKDASIGVYDYIRSSVEAIPSIGTQFLFVVGVYRDVLKSGQWPVVAHLRFDKADDAWPPPYVVRDVISGGCSIYHKGKMRPSSPEMCENLEPAEIWDEHEIVDRILSHLAKGEKDRGKSAE
jgi:hypothetical protein